MRADISLRAATIALLALSLGSVTVGAQAPVQGATVQATTSITKLQAIRPPKIGGDNTAAAVMVGIPNLYAFMTAVPGDPKATVTLRNVAAVEESANGKPPMFLAASGVIWLSVGNAPAGYYHVRFDGAPMSGTTLEIHLGQLASDPLVATCSLTGTTSCDVIVSNPGGTFSLAGVVTGGRLQFWDVYVAPTTKPLSLP